MHTANRRALVLGLLGLLLGSACENPQGFVEPKKYTDTIVNLRNYVLPGQAQLVYRVEVQPEPQMTHPHFEGRWNFADVEKPVDVYVLRAEHYVETAPPASQDSLLFWSSLENAVVGQQRETSMHLHPAPGSWVIVFYNAGPATSTGRATFSADESLSYFK
jgi:hypothetical protein